jgi:hypothetical protein
MSRAEVSPTQSPPQGTAAHLNNFELGQHGRNRTNVWDYAGVNTFRSGRMDELQMHPTVNFFDETISLIFDKLLNLTVHCIP